MDYNYQENMDLLKSKNLYLEMESDVPDSRIYSVYIKDYIGQIITGHPSIDFYAIPEWLNGIIDIVEDYKKPSSFVMCGGRTVGKTHRVNKIINPLSFGDHCPYNHSLQFDQGTIVSSSFIKKG